jgi:putative cell wall-binding protein
MKKVFMICLLAMLIVMPTVSAFSASEKASVTLIYLSDSSFLKYTHWKKESMACHDKTKEYFNSKLSTNFSFRTNDSYAEKLKPGGFTDLASIEIGNILSLFKDGEADYIMCIELKGIHRPVLSINSYEDVTMYIKILDYKNKNYLYNGRVHANAPTPKKALDKILLKVDPILNQLELSQVDREKM